jgi:hypothetical protein
MKRGWYKNEENNLGLLLEKKSVVQRMSELRWTRLEQRM